MKNWLHFGCGGVGENTHSQMLLMRLNILTSK